MNKLILLILSFIHLNATYYYQNGHKVLLEKTTALKYLARSFNNIQYYRTKNNNTLGVKDDILIKTKYDINTILKTYNIKLIKQITKNIYLLKINKSQDIFDISNKLYNDKNIIYAHPNFIKQINKR